MYSYMLIEIYIIYIYICTYIHTWVEVPLHSTFLFRKQNPHLYSQEDPKENEKRQDSRKNWQKVRGRNNKMGSIKWMWRVAQKFFRLKKTLKEVKQNVCEASFFTFWSNSNNYNKKLMKKPKHLQCSRLHSSTHIHT